MENTLVRMPEQLRDQIMSDLRRPHEFAYERVGFCYGKSAKLKDGSWIVILNQFKSVKDEYYIRTREVGARINSKAITEAFQFAYSNSLSLFHVHLHDFGSALPHFSPDDLRSGKEILESINSFVETQVHGLILLSQEGFNAITYSPGSNKLTTAYQISVVGTRLNVSFPTMENSRTKGSERYSRQTFLGEESEQLFPLLKVGVIGLSGGGSHVVQQLAHIGFQRYVLSDPDHVDDESNLNRVVSATLEDAKRKQSKFKIFLRLIRSLHPNAEIGGGQKRWEEITEELKSCDIIFGCLDTILGRRDLENFCRRYLIPYIDIGMGIETSRQPYAMFGQAQISLPGHPCMLCNGFITEDSLKKEANNYGQKTKRPQVVWPNGVLASTAIGIAVELITGWTGIKKPPEYLSYSGNDHTIVDHLRKSFRTDHCRHYPLEESGPQKF